MLALSGTLWIRPHRLLRPLSGIICGVVYCPPNLKAQQEKDLVDHIINNVDLVTTAHPDCGILGDFNTLNITDLLLQHDLSQIVQAPTRGNNSLDLIITNLPHLYSIPVISVPLGTSDHNSVLWSPVSNTSKSTPGPQTTKVLVRRFTESSCMAFGRWSSTHNWFLTCNLLFPLVNLHHLSLKT